MKISVIMPVYNGEKYLKESIDSILNQTFKDFEFIIINDCSTDKTEQIIKSYDDKRIVYIKNPVNMGVAASLNVGLDVAKGEYIARMDADDISLPERFEKQVMFLNKHRECGLCGTDIVKFDGLGNEQLFLFSHDYEAIKVDLIFDSAVAHPTVMMRRSLSKVIELKYNPEFEKAEDFELWTRVSDVAKIANLGEVLLKYRVHNMQVSNVNSVEQNNSCKKIRHTNLKKILGNEAADKYISTIDDLCNKKIMSKEQYGRLCECFELIKQNNKVKKIYNSRVLGNQLALIKLNLSKKNGFPFKIKDGYDIAMLLKVQASTIKNRLR